MNYLFSWASLFIKGLALQIVSYIVSLWSSPGPAAGAAWCSVVLSQCKVPALLYVSPFQCLRFLQHRSPAFVWLLHVWPLLHNNLVKRLSFTFRYHSHFVLRLWALGYFSLDLLFSFLSSLAENGIYVLWKWILNFRSKLSLAFQDTLFQTDEVLVLFHWC